MFLGWSIGLSALIAMKGKLLLSASIRGFTPRTSRGRDLEKKKEFRERILSSVEDITATRMASRGRLLSASIRFYLFGRSGIEGRAKKDLDNMLKIVLDTLPDYMDRARTQSGLGLIEGDSDDPIFEVQAVKKLVSEQEDEGIDLELFEWLS